jgi:hypothetical protein
MQCLFCGKELALLKRLRGGAEFCSEAHRKEYQEQYEQLALARLLQAKPPTEPATPLGRPSPLIAPDPGTDPGLESPYAEMPAPAEPQPEVHSSPYIEAPANSQPAEEAGPAPLAGFLNEPVVPAVAPFECVGLLELERVLKHVTTPPSLTAAASGGSDASAASGSEGYLLPAPRVELEVAMQAVEHHTRTSERGMELREFTGPAPVMELQLRPDTGTEPAAAADAMEILMSPHPPQKAKSWLGPPRGFPAATAELGQLARLDFSTTGFAYSDSPVAAPSPSGPQAAVLTPEPPQAAPEMEPMVAPAPAEPAPSVQAPLPSEPAPPELVTKVLPVTLHGLAASRGKLAQTFTSAITAASDVQIPTSAALPLRPTIVFGPRPAPARAPEAAPAPVQPKPVQPKPVQTAPVQPKPVPEKSVEVKTERAKPSVIPAPKSVPVKRPAAPATTVPMEPRVEPRVDPRVEARVERPVVEPRRDLAAFKPETASASDALPSLRMEATESAWSKLSSGLKIGVAAAVVVALSGIAYLVTRGNGKATSAAPVAAAPANSAVASGVPISGGWIDDWANASKSRRHISMLSGSVKLSDYRLEFQSQIQTKAIGWIFRGLNPRNYYVAKLEIVTPGLEPTVALVHFAVVDGQDEDRVVVPLPMKVRIDTDYKIRFDAIGTHFTTWVQDQKIAEWTDSRFGSGGVGLFSDRDEQAALQGTVNVVALVPKN